MNPRVAVMVFENQSDSPDLAWAALLASEGARQRLSVDPQRSPVLLRSQEELRQSGAGLVLYGSLRRSATQLRFDSYLVDTASGKRLQAIVGTGGSTAEEAALLAAEQATKTLLGAQAKPIAGSPAAWRALTEASTNPSAEALASVPARFPDFGPGYLAWIDWLQRSGDAAQAKAVSERLPANLDPDSLAQIALRTASDVPSRTAALVKLIARRQTDPVLRAELASIQQRGGDWKSAAAEYETLHRLEPENPNWLNLLGYAKANQGDWRGAVQAMESYGKLLPNEANPLDSLGEVHYLSGKFAEAAKVFDQAAAKFANQTSGVELRKAAFAYYRAGDLKTADQRFESWMKAVLANAPPHAQVFQRAAWLARTGRWQKQGQALLETEIAATSGERQSAAQMHLALLRFALQGFGSQRTRPDPNSFSQWNRLLVDASLRNTLSIFAFLSQPATSEAEWRKRAESVTQRPELAELRQQLLNAVGRIHQNTSSVKAAPDSGPTALPNNMESALSVFEISVLP